MSIVHKTLINAYAVLVLAGDMELKDVLETEVTLDNGSKSTIRAQVEIEVAKRTIEILGK